MITRSRSEFQLKMGLTHDLARRVVEQWRLPSGRVEVITNGVDLSRFKPAADNRAMRAALGIPSDAFVIGSVRSLREVKNPGFLNRAFAEFNRRASNAFLLIVGDGPLRSELEALGRTLGVSRRILLRGRQANVRDHIVAMDLFVQPSFKEGSPTAVLEALACRVLRNLKSRTLFVGCGDSIRRTSEAVAESEAGRNYVLLGYLAGSESESNPPGATDLPRLVGVEDIQAVCLAEDVQEVVIGAEESSDAELSQLIMCCLRLGCRVTNQPTFHERVLGEVPVDYISADWFLFADLEGHRAGRATLKRVFDFSFAPVTLLLTLPLWPLIALAVKLSGSGPVFYSQERVGRHNRIFRLIKFRTMHPDAEADGQVWSTPGDPRMTRVGRFLRRTHLDELPQL